MPRVGIVHPDLGIGGAERLVVDIGLALKELGYDVVFFTSHHDPSHCFPETKNFEVIVKGDWFPRCIFGGYFHMLCSLIRSFLVTIYVLLFAGSFDFFIVDQVSAVIPLLKTKAPVLFYCHFPDQLLAPQHSWLRKVYRYPLNLFEKVTTAMSDVILVNSLFTRSVLLDTFKNLHGKQINVLYPCIHVPSSEKDHLDGNASFNFLSINRFERKKNLELAIQAFGILESSVCEDLKDKLHLVIAGGYDCRVTENVQCFQELAHMAKPFGTSVELLRSICESEKYNLLRSSTCVLYTPKNEHFGIVPVEAMANGVPVIAVNSGGPVETVIDGQTGFLCPQVPEEFAKAMKTLIESPKLRKDMAECAKEHVKQKFSFQEFTRQLKVYIATITESKKAR